MFKKILLIIIGLILLLLISFAAIYEASSAAAAEENIIIKTCEIKKLNDYLSLKKDDKGVIQGGGYKNLNEAFSKSDGYSSEIKIRMAFENARTEYHETIKCVFDIASIKILGSAGGIGDNIRKNDIPDLSKALIDLNDTDKMCTFAESGKLKKIINDNGPEQLIQPILEAYSNYANFINYLADTFKNVEIKNTGSNIGLGDYGDKYLRMKNIMGNEIQDSIVALDSAFQSLKEMRIAFVIHARFECMLKNLQMYQKMLKNVRSIISALPSAIEDASMHK